MSRLVVGKFTPVFTGILPVLTIPLIYDHNKSANTTAPLVAISLTLSPTKSITASCASSCSVNTINADGVPR